MASIDRKRRRAQLRLLRGGKKDSPKSDTRYPAGRFAEALNLFTRSALAEDAALDKPAAVAVLLQMSASLTCEIPEATDSDILTALGHILHAEREARSKAGG